jgi:hypothetical protein
MRPRIDEESATSSASYACFQIGVANSDYHYQSQNATVLGLLVISGFIDSPNVDAGLAFVPPDTNAAVGDTLSTFFLTDTDGGAVCRTVERSQMLSPCGTRETLDC